MISMEVGALFKVLDEATGPLQRILREVRTLQGALDKLKASMLEVGKFTMPVGIIAATDEATALGIAWARVAESAKAAAAELGIAGRAARAAGAGTPVAAAVAADGGGRRGFAAALRGGYFGGRGGGGHITAPGIPLGGGAHWRFGGTGAMIGGGILGYAAYEAMQLEDIITQALWHEDPTRSMQDPARRAELRKIIEDTLAQTGAGMEDVGKAAIQEIRMFKGTTGGGMPVLPEMLRAAAVEARLKGTSVTESMTALTGLAHMTLEYSPEEIAKLAPAFAYLSSVNPATLGSMERAASYAVPILHSGLEIDPMDALLLGTVMTRAGATNTKSGTWLRELAIRAMPGTSLMSKVAYRKHEAALQALGLDVGGRPTWFTDEGKPDLMKMLEIASEHAQNIPLTKRAALERQLFGAQGAGAFSLLADPAIREQITNLKNEMKDFEGAYPNFLEMYREGSPLQQFRTTWAELKNVLMDIGSIILPPVVAGLKALDDILKVLHGDLPASQVSPWKMIGAGALTGAGIGGMFGGLPGALIGGAAGALIGGGYWGGAQPGGAWGGPAPPAATPAPAPFYDPLSGAPLPGPPPKKMGFLSGPPVESGGGDSGGSVYLDGKKVGDIILDYIGRGASRPIEGSAYLDGTRPSYTSDMSLSYG